MPIETLTLANTDWAIVQDVRDALVGAHYEGDPVFRKVIIVTDLARYDENRAGEYPQAAVCYQTTDEDLAPEDVRPCQVQMTIRAVARVERDVDDEAARVEEALKRKNLIRNALAAWGSNLESAAAAGHHEGKWFRELDWGQPSIVTTDDEPWVVIDQQLDIGSALDDGTKH